MATENTFRLFPNKKLRAFDGMAVTADVWDQAHTYHDQFQRTHNLFFHGAGILTGLEVIASDPPDRMVYILPGVAVDLAGQIIVLPEAVAYDIGNDIEGQLFLLLSYRESAPRSSNGNEQSSPQFTESQYSITARPAIPDQPVVELARFNRESRTAFLLDAQNPLEPRLNEIDLRYRHAIDLATASPMTVGVIYQGKVREPVHGSGLARTTYELSHASRVNMVVEDNQQLNPNVLGFTMLYLVAEGKFQLNASQIKGLQGYLERGGTLLLESCDEESAADLKALCEKLGTALNPLQAGDPLLLQPYLFAAPPVEGGEVLIGEGVIFSSAAIGPFWAGKSGKKTASRAELRTAVEWAANLAFYALERRRTA
jgi:hypothetical protein